ncbi:MAG: murein L,D-transpeptidase [Comamonadaceae bacterium]|nr:MAG: murein L,D-transpeptidase [Comamonadaceae bacterium]
MRRGLAAAAASACLACVATGATAVAAATPGDRLSSASADVLQVTDWITATGDSQQKPFVVIDKKAARIFVFESNGRLRGTSPVLLGSARGDDSVPGIGDRPLSHVLPHERTTPAGRFVSEHGVNLQGEDIIWIDYDAAVSMHRVRANIPAERRLQRLASATPEDNRISYGCVNIPAAFYDRVLKPVVGAGSAVVYVLPEMRPVREVFGF